MMYIMMNYHILFYVAFRSAVGIVRPITTGFVGITGTHVLLLQRDFCS